MQARGKRRSSKHASRTRTKYARRESDGKGQRWQDKKVEGEEEEGKTGNNDLATEANVKSKSGGQDPSRLGHDFFFSTAFFPMVSLP